MTAYPAPASPETHLAEYWQILCRRRAVMTAFFIICFSTVTLGTFLMKPLYEASSTLIIEGENTNVLNASESSADINNYNVFENYIETQIAIIKSDAVAGKVFEEFKLKDSPRYREKVILGKKFQRKFTDDISIERLRDTRMIDISVFAPGPQLASDIANRLAELYSRDNMMRRALTFIRNQRMASLNAEYLRLQSKLDSLSNQFGPKHPDMMALKEEIRTMANRIQNPSLADSQAGKSLSENQTLLEESLLKIQESSVLASSKMSNVAIVDRATPSNEIAKPRRGLNVVLGFLLGLVGGVLLAFFVDYMDDSIKTEEDAKKYLENTVYLGSLLSEKASKHSLARFPRIDHLVFDAKDSASAEAYRLLRTRILWSVPEESPLKDVAVLSSIPGEGKSAVASNLAIALSQINLKVLLVDADLRKGRVHESYELPNDKGLANYLTEKLSLDSAVKKTYVPGLFVMTKGGSAIDSSQLFSSGRMKKFIEEVKQQFDMVIYDTPPLTVIADAAILVSQVGGAILILRSGMTSVRVSNKGLGILRESHAHLLGAVLNDVDSSETRLYSHYYHDYQKS